ncbi:MAG: hypothetical protein ACLPX5_16945 [Dissulfurispiraceae bacterium]
MKIYCHQIGITLDLSYCISMNEGLPCRNTLGCWKERTEIIKLLRGRFTGLELKKAFGGLPKSRIERIVEYIDKQE